MTLVPATVARNIKNAVAPDLTEFQSSELTRAGLNLQAVFDLIQLPAELIEPIKILSGYSTDYRQLILLGHFGTRMWQQQNKESNKQPVTSEDPIDNYSIQTVERVFSNKYPHIKTQLIYPLKGKADTTIGLQQLGALVGWHSDSPLKVGINQHWGTWSAYRIAMLANSQFSVTVQQQATSPCISCQQKACISACPAQALEEKQFDLTACINYRKSDHSSCKDRCLARMACPIGKEHQYSVEQINYHYRQSMRVIETYDPKKSAKSTS
ncbi:MAG: hypothetical protein KUG78_14770 [Kangiellaceae bacterium]|nr:hypothetical protein [Kangiellaceae bacterium]